MFTLTLHTVLSVVNPGQGSAPPGSGKIETIIKWAAWIVFALCVVGVLFSAARMAVSNSRGHGGGGEHAASLGWVLGACVLAGSASAIVGALV